MKSEIFKNNGQTIWKFFSDGIKVEEIEKNEQMNKLWVYHGLFISDMDYFPNGQGVQWTFRW